MKGWFKAIDNWIYQRRALSLLLAILLTLAIVSFLNWATGSDLFRQFFFPKSCNRNLPGICDALEWKDLFQASLIVLGLPVAFLLWHWRDTNVRDQIEEQRRQVENARLDTNLKEFEEVQLRAAGALDEKLPQEAREQLQIAALHQLRGFLRGDYGDSFKRPAFELLLAGHAAAINRIGVPEVQAQVRDKSRAQIRKAVDALRTKLTPIDRTRMLIIRDEAEHIFRVDYPLDGRRFDLLDLASKNLAGGRNYSFGYFFGADMHRTHLEGANLRFAHLEGADLDSARLEGSTLYGASLEGAVLGAAHLEGANMSNSRLTAADLSHARLQGVDLTITSLGGADLSYADLRSANVGYAKVDDWTDMMEAEFDSDTSFDKMIPTRWPNLPESEKEAARAPWIARGMINVDAPPETENPSG